MDSPHSRPTSSQGYRGGRILATPHTFPQCSMEETQEEVLAAWLIALVDEDRWCRSCLVGSTRELASFNSMSAEEACDVQVSQTGCARL